MWFEEAGGTEALAKRLEGLEPLLLRAPGQTVLDLGCGEGLISREFIARGAGYADAVGVVPEELEAGRRCCSGEPIEFHRIDLADARARSSNALLRQYGIVLALSVAQKLPHPAAFLHWAASKAHGWIAVRVPCETFRPKRGGDRVSVRAVMEEAGAQPRITGGTSWGAWYGLFEVNQ